MNQQKMNRRQMLGSAAAATAAGAAGVMGSAAASAAAPAAAAAEPAFPDLGTAQAPTITDLKDKVCYITGGSSGIGLGIAQALHENGARIILGNLDDKQFAEALKKFPANDPRVATVVHDVMKRDLWEAKADEIEKKFGPVDILVNNAGVGLQGGLTSTYNDWDWGMGVNFWGPVYGIKTFVPRMRARNTGCHIVTTTSTSGVLVGLNVGIYAVSKIAATGLMEQLRNDLRATNIGTSTLIPGLTQTNIGQSEQRRPEELRNAPTPPPAATPAGGPAAARGGAPGAGTRAGGPGAPGAAAPAAAQSPFWARPQDPLTVGRVVVDGILNNDLFIFPAPEYRQGVLARAYSMIDSMVPFVPFPPNVEQGIANNQYLFTPMYTQEIAHRRATRKRSIPGI